LASAQSEGASLCYRIYLPRRRDPPGSDNHLVTYTPPLTEYDRINANDGGVAELMLNSAEKLACADFLICPITRFTSCAIDRRVRGK
jgi:hypothetical protein